MSLASSAVASCTIVASEAVGLCERRCPLNKLFGHSDRLVLCREIADEISARRGGVRHCYGALALPLEDRSRHFNPSEQRNKNVVSAIRVGSSSYPAGADLGELAFDNRAAVEVVDSHLSAILNDGFGNWFPFHRDGMPVVITSDLPRRPYFAD